MDTSKLLVPEEEIARRAYELWEARGRPAGDGGEDWQAAKSELIGARFTRNGPEGRGLLNWWRRVRRKTNA